LVISNLRPSLCNTKSSALFCLLTFLYTINFELLSLLYNSDRLGSLYEVIMVRFCLYKTKRTMFVRIYYVYHFMSAISTFYLGNIKLSTSFYILDRATSIPCDNFAFLSDSFFNLISYCDSAMILV